MEDFLVTNGGAVKSLGGGKYEAPLVLFGTAENHDLSRDFFTPDTKFWRSFPSSVPALYDHGRDKTLKMASLGVGGEVALELKTGESAGVWLAGQLDLSNQYEAAIYKLIEAGKMGTSSGSAPHMVKRQKVGDAYEVVSWPIVEASLTTTPCEPRTRQVMSVKTFAALERENELDLSGLKTELPENIRELEDYLRDVGNFSRTEAKTIVSKCFKSLRDADEPEARSTNEGLRLRYAHSRQTSRLRDAGLILPVGVSA